MAYFKKLELHEERDLLLSYAEQLCDERLEAYRAAPHDSEEHANIETAVLAGGYAYRQVAELIQNAADAIADAGSESAGRIHVEADNYGLWCANTGIPLDAAGVRALLNSHASGKRAGQIGRFGLGFKSLLRLGGCIDVMSRSVCLHFNPVRCRTKIRSHLNLALDAPAPGLRLADPGRWVEEVATAPGAERFGWATTIVFAELLAHGARKAVNDEIRQFPAEFLLFLPCDVELILVAGPARRHLRRRTEPDGSVVVEDLASERPITQRWRIFETSVRITDAAALEDATGVHAREQIPLIWATPAGTARETAGRFFAFFPTATETRTLGILNAPWKLNSDRTAVIPGAWNAALMQAAADLIVDKLPVLASEGDPGAVLDAFPREGALNEPAAPLISALWARLIDRPTLPNCDAEACLPQNLFRAPCDDTALLTSWSRLADPEACANHLHPTCTSTTARTGRLRQLSERLNSAAHVDGLPRLKAMPPVDWIQRTASTVVDAAADALRFADQYASTVTGWQWDQIRDSARLILTAVNTVVAAPESTLASPADPPLQSVHPVICADHTLRRILKQKFDVLDGEETDWERLVDIWADRAQLKNDWTEVWKLLRRMPWEDFLEQKSRHEIRVKTFNGWALPGQVIDVGALLSLNDLSEIADDDIQLELSAMVLDETIHAEDRSYLNELGISPYPASEWSAAYVPESDCIAGRWLRDWQEACTGSYHEHLEFRPDRHLLKPEDFEMPAGWALLLLCPPHLLSRVTAWFVELCEKTECSHLEPVVFRHSSRPNAWERQSYPHPFFQLLNERGSLANAHASIPLSYVLDPGMPDPSLLPSMHPLAGGLTWLRAMIDEEDASSWHHWLAFAAGETDDPQALKDLWNKAAEFGHVPQRVCTVGGPVDLKQVRLTTSEREISLAQQAGLAAVCLTRSAARLWMEAGAKSFEQDSSLEWIPESEEAPTVPLLDLEPALKDVMKPSAIGDAVVTITALMEQHVGEHRSSVDWIMRDGQLLISQDALTREDWTGRVRLLLDAATAAGWIGKENALEEVITSGVSARRRAVASEPDLPSRLLRATGGTSGVSPLFEPDVRAMLEPDPQRMASVALTLYGPSLLTQSPILNALRDQGLEPPERWGTEAASDFVASIGFTAEYATSPSERREAELAISGPLPLKPLHDFQEEIVHDLKVILKDRTSARRRAVISLPTGAGKTRVAAETAVREVLVADSENRLVLWIAQSDELCEQAVQCFRELWSNVGSRGEMLRLIRLWGGQQNPVAVAGDEPAVIVASIQTLTSRMNDAALAWLKKPGLIVIDECHHALTPAYSDLFRWAKTGSETIAIEPPIVGLSATPFRGRSEEETQQLARRFDNRLLPARQAHLFEMMQERGVLARFTYTPLIIDQRFVLTDEEEKHLDKFQQLNDTALKRLGEDSDRNDRILEAIRASEEKSVLVFAASVAHAQRLAARLNVLGISAATVTGETDRSSRRWFIRAFQHGDIRVLCNHSALTTGFDAPATDLIVIARPVFSPALYMQMVGRGLRGPANGGKKDCRIMTVQDNLDAYTGRLAHHYFEQHYLGANAADQ